MRKSKKNEIWFDFSVKYVAIKTDFKIQGLNLHKPIKK
jgi:hypothetical protein